MAASGRVTILVVEDDPTTREEWLERIPKSMPDVAVEGVENFDRVVELWQSGFRPDIAILDHQLSASGEDARDGDSVARWLFARTPAIRVVVTTGYATDPVQDKLVYQLYMDISPRIVFTEKRGTIQQELTPKLVEWVQELRGQRSALFQALADRLVARSEAMQRFVNELSTAVVGTTTVLLLGETGVGKSFIARQMHETRKTIEGITGNYVDPDCNQLDENLALSELFGHRKGAYTGAHADRVGAFALAGDGTVFLDEIGDASPKLQGMLLRVLNDRTFKPLGQDENKTTKAKIVLATNRSLSELHASRAFRHDLLRRMAEGVVLTVPPLRDRREDVGIVAQRYLEAEHPGYYLNEPAAMELVKCDWSEGNIGQLRGALSAAVRKSGTLTQLGPHLFQDVCARKGYLSKSEVDEHAGCQIATSTIHRADDDLHQVVRPDSQKPRATSLVLPSGITIDKDAVLEATDYVSQHWDAQACEPGALRDHLTQAASAAVLLIVMHHLDTGGASVAHARCARLFVSTSAKANAHRAVEAAAKELVLGQKRGTPDKNAVHKLREKATALEEMLSQDGPLSERRRQMLDKLWTSMREHGAATTTVSPKRLWTRTLCPNCAKNQVEFVSCSEFVRRCKEAHLNQPRNHETVSRRVRDGRYCADRNWAVPWCSECMNKTPEGRGEAESAEAPRSDGPQIDDAQVERLKAMAQRVTKSHFPNFDVAFAENGSSSLDAECFREGLAALVKAVQQSPEALTDNRLKEVAEGAITAFMKVENREGHHFPYHEGGNRPEEE